MPEIGRLHTNAATAPQLHGLRLAICCGYQNGDDDEFLCFTDPKTPVVKKLFKKIDATPELTRLTDAMQAILSSDPQGDGQP